MEPSWMEHMLSKEMNDEAAGMCSYLEERDATEAI
jgi:hypothetical protein